jgi:hypothetical protein
MFVVDPFMSLNDRLATKTLAPRAEPIHTLPSAALIANSPAERPLGTADVVYDLFGFIVFDTC